ncbi:TIM barrel protein [Duganella sp. FT50W]|uniref:TIM barrel protein n=1 Tax=Duganella lactea TaxID=2692173 RepID=A0A6L8ML73_9BURK|nr:sugar phosphate isomerase/epimerase family protein [Duganella lactea]MYM83379.1 TIM barrel protein [Duganella lactea]
MIKWGYGVNQWKAGFTSFARLEEIERALKVTAACGFDAVELNAGSGRWDPIGRPENVAINYGSATHFRLKLKDLGIHHVASTFFDPTVMSFEELHFGLMSTQPGDHARIVAQARIHAEMLAELGGKLLVVRPFPSFWKEGALNGERLHAAADCWNQVGAMAASLGLKVALHVDALSALRSEDELEQLLQRCDRDHVGLALDTAELTIAGHDVVALYRRFHARVLHFHFKDALAVDTLGEYQLQNAERAMIAAGGEREIQRWFGEMGTGLVDFPALLAAIKEHRYAGWIIVESDKGPEPIATGMMLNSWYKQNVLDHV